MPIYAYRCDVCGHAKDVLQKISDPVLSTCPACGADAFRKQVTAAGFQLKGSGWYVTDFRNGSQPAAKPADADASAKPAQGDAKAEAKADAAPSAAKTDAKNDAKAAPTASPAPPAPAAPSSGPAPA